MKRLIVSAVALTATAASASGFKATITGFSNQWVGYANYKDYRGTKTEKDGAFWYSDSEVHFSFMNTTAANTTRYGVNVEVEVDANVASFSDTNGDKTNKTSFGNMYVDEIYAWAEGNKWGKVILGNQDTSATLLGVDVDALGIVGDIHNIFSSNGGVNVIDMFDGVIESGDAGAVTYISPKFWGVSMGASYILNSGQTNSGFSPDGYAVDAVVRYDNSWSNGMNFAASVAYRFAEFGRNTSVELVSNDWKAAVKGGDYSEYAVGARLGWDAVAVAVAFKSHDGTHQAPDYNVLNASLQYNLPAWGLSFTYKSFELGALRLLENKQTETIYEIAGRYALTQGVDLKVSLDYVRTNHEKTISSTVVGAQQSWNVATGLAISF